MTRGVASQFESSGVSHGLDVGEGEGEVCDGVRVGV